MLLVAGDRDEFLGGDRRRPGVCRLGGVGRRRRRIRSWGEFRKTQRCPVLLSGSGETLRDQGIRPVGPGVCRSLAGRDPVGAAGGRGCDPWPALGRSNGRSGCMGRRRATGADRTLRAAKTSLDRGTAEFAKNRVRTIREVPCPAGYARSGRASGTVDPYRRYLRIGTFKGPSSLRSGVGVSTVRRTWLIRPAAKLRRATLHITCAWVGGVLYWMASREMGCNRSFSVAD